MITKMKYTYALLLLFIICRLAATEVGGHITQNTTWSPVNNPYEVIHNIYINSGVTLTILPGTEVKLHAAIATEETQFVDFEVTNEDSNAKIIYVHGRIVAVGTEQDSITFTRYEETPDNMRWGNIVFDESAPKSTFKYCKFMYSLHCGIQVAAYLGALCCDNGMIDISHCRFVEPEIGIYLYQMHESVLLSYNVFEKRHYLGWGSNAPAVEVNSSTQDYELIFAYNRYYGGLSQYWLEVVNSPVSHLFEYVNLPGFENTRCDSITYRTVYNGDTYGNYVIDSPSSGAASLSTNPAYKGYVRRNHIINSGGIDTHGTVEISDNELINCDHLNAEYEGTPSVTNIDVFNNRLNNTRLYHYGNGRIYNNVSFGFGTRNAFYVSPGVTEIRNNTVYNGAGGPIWWNQLNPPLHVLVEKNIFYNVHALNYAGTHLSQCRFRYNCMATPTQMEFAEYTGNIEADPMFVNADSADFHLLPNSPCIDVGIDIPPFLLMDAGDNHRRVNRNGSLTQNPIIDIGAYEYNSHYTGGFTGHLYLSPSEPLALAKVDIEGVITSREYTDSTGFFTFNAPQGTYTLHIHHIYEGDRTFTVQIQDNQLTESNLYWDPVGIYDDTSNSTIPSLSLHNYPNPFGKETNIGYTLSKSGQTTCRIYNLKGQLVKTLSQGKQSKGYQTCIWTGENDKGRQTASGIYYLKVETDGKSAMHKMLRVR